MKQSIEIIEGTVDYDCEAELVVGGQPILFTLHKYFGHRVRVTIEDTTPKEEK